MAEKIKEIEKAIQEHESRISRLEEAVLEKGKEPRKPQEFKGLSGGIEYLISKGYLDSPKSVKEIQEELRKEGYHYQRPSVNKMLSVDFTVKQRSLTRITEKNVVKYVVRK